MSKRSRKSGSRMEPKSELTDEQWRLIAEFFPHDSHPGKRGRPPIEPRACVEGILWVLRSGARWKDMPDRFPSYATCWRRFQEWTASGVWEKVWSRLLRVLHRQGRIDLSETTADGTFSSAKKGAISSARPSGAREPRPWFSPTPMGCRSRRLSPAPVLTRSL